MMKDIKKLVSELTDKYDTRNPFALAEYLGITVQKGELGRISGCQLKVDGRQFIYVNSDAPRYLQQIVAAHELGHAIMHEADFYFFTYGACFYKSNAEIEAHTFAAELLVPDEIVMEHPGYTKKQLAALTGYTERLLAFKRL